MLDIDQEGRFLSLFRGFVKISDHGSELGRVPLDQVGTMVVSAQGATLTKGLLVELAERGEITVLCDGHYLPLAMVWPYKDHTQIAERLGLQIDVSLPLRKQLWRTVVQSKILNQGLALTAGRDEGTLKLMVAFAIAVKSGDSDNREAVAAQFYWSRMFGPEFRRSDESNPLNARLNFAYTLLRSSMARALCAAGLHPALSLFHRQKGNLFALADDLMEPYRPFADLVVKESLDMYPADVQMDRPLKKALCDLLSWDIVSPRGMTPLGSAMAETVRTLVGSYTAKKPLLWLPECVGRQAATAGE